MMASMWIQAVTLDPGVQQVWPPSLRLHAVNFTRTCWGQNTRSGPAVDY